MPQLHTLSVLVNNKPGVLGRVAGLISRRAYNIESLAVAPTDNPRFSQLNMTVDVELVPLEQIIKQLFKLIDVVKISELSPQTSTVRELMMATVNVCCRDHQTSPVTKLVNVFGGIIVDVGRDALTILLVSEPAKLDEFEVLLQPFGIIDMQRTGRVALPKLAKSATWFRVASNPVVIKTEPDKFTSNDL